MSRGILLPSQSLGQPEAKFHWGPGGVIALALFGSFAWLYPRLGFYHDDWGFLEYFSRAPDYWGRVRLLAETNDFWSRPVAILQMPLFFTVAGVRPGAHQALLLVLQLLEGLLLFKILEGLWRDRGLALAAACLAAVFPNRWVHHVWYAASMQNVSIVLVAGSLLLHGRARAGGGLGLLPGQALYLLGVLCYESPAFLPLLRAGALTGRRLAEGSPPGRALRDAGRDLWPYAASLCAVAAWQLAALPWLFGAHGQKLRGVEFTLPGLAAHALKAYGAGLECVSNRVLHACWLGAREVAEAAPFLLLAALAFSAVLAWALRRREEGPEAGALASAWGAAAGAFLGGYAPYALSGSYMPQVFGIMSRTNGPGAWAGGILAAAGLEWLRRWAGAKGPPRRAQGLALPLALTAFSVANWGMGLQWARSWALQQEILSRLGPPAAALPPGSRVLLAGATSHEGTAPVFLTDYDFRGALRLVTGRPDLEGDASTDAAARGKGRERAYVYRFDQDRLEPLGE